MPPIDDPFQVVEGLLKEVRETADVVVVDFHAEATSEKGRPFVYPPTTR